MRKAARFICFSVLADELVGVTRGKDEKLEKNEKNEKKNVHERKTRTKSGWASISQSSSLVWFSLDGLVQISQVAICSVAYISFVGQYFFFGGTTCVCVCVCVCVCLCV